MSNLKRQAIVSLAAIAGAQVANLILSPTSPGQTSSCLQWASESISAVQQNVQYAVQPPPVSEQGYYDVRTKRDEPVYPLNQSQAAATAPGAAAYAPSGTANLPIQAPNQPVSRSAEMSMIPDVSEAESYSRQLAIPSTGADR